MAAMFASPWRCNSQLCILVRKLPSKVTKHKGEHKCLSRFFYSGGRWTVVGRSSDGRRTAVGRPGRSRPLDGCPTAVRRPSDGSRSRSDGHRTAVGRPSDGRPIRPWNLSAILKRLRLARHRPSLSHCSFLCLTPGGQAKQRTV